LQCGAVSLEDIETEADSDYGLRQEEDRNRAVTSAARSFSGLGIEKTFVVAIG
jgi:hypothetical protein